MNVNILSENGNSKFFVYFSNFDVLCKYLINV